MLHSLPEDWLAENHHRLFGDIIDPAIEDIRTDMPQSENLWEELLQLCVFREFDRSIIRELFPEKNRIVYTDRLEQYGLVTRERQIFRDGVLRPAMLRWLQFGKPDLARIYCDQAKTILKRKLTNAASSIEQMPLILAEILHLCLLESHEVLLQGDPERRRVRHLQIEQEMKEYIRQSLLDSGEDADEFIDTLRRILYADTKLNFLFNYIFKSYVRIEHRRANSSPAIEQRELDYALQVERFAQYCAEIKPPISHE